MRTIWLEPADVPTHYFSPSSAPEATAVLVGAVSNGLHRLINQREDEVTWLVAKRIADAALAGTLIPFESEPSTSRDDTPAILDMIEQHIKAVQAMANSVVLSSEAAPPSAALQYAYGAMWTGCWLRTSSQPATQPATVTNQLFRQYFHLMGEARRERSEAAKWERHLSSSGRPVPAQTATSRWEAIGVRCDTFLIVCIQQALGFFGASYLPEIIGFNWAWQAVDTGRAFLMPAQENSFESKFARNIATGYLTEWQDAPTQITAARERVMRGALLAIALKRLQLQILQDCRADACMALDQKVAMIFSRHFHYAGPQHGNVKVGGKRLVDIFSAPNFNALAFVKEFKQSHWTRANEGTQCRFLDAIRFGGPMFGIFNEEETHTIKNWLEEHPLSDNYIPSHPIAAVHETFSAVLEHPTCGIVFENSPSLTDDREWLYRLVNIERFPNLLTQAEALSTTVLNNASRTIWNGNLTRYTNASAFKWSPDALQQRVQDIYQKKLQAPCVPVKQMPSKEEVIFRQKTFALGNLIDGAWLYRIDPVISNYPGSWEMFAIYADEMGCGEQNKNHIALIYEVLESMEIALPHIATSAFREQDELLDDFYPFAIFQLAMALFPHKNYAAILGYNLAIEMFGLGELRKQEIEKLRYWKFSTIYEITHLSIDNLSSGHASISIDAIANYMESAQRYVGKNAIDTTFAAIWSGYGAFAKFIENHECIKTETENYII